MKKYMMLWAAAVLLGSCANRITVEISNTSQTPRDNETVEIAWSEIASLKGITPENVVVCDKQGKQIPSQVIYRGGEAPLSIIFQVSTDALTTEEYRIGTGTRDTYEAKAYGRQVPERYDDYAWENDKVAYRLYGPALEVSPEKLITPGIDVWVKSKEKLVLDERYARGDYHHDNGDGMDCYKVGITLGSGASLPFVGGRLHLMSHNYVTAETLDNGPIRTSVKLVYAPFDVDSTQVSLVKYITLDAHSHFNRMENSYEGDFSEMPIAAGFVRHDIKALSTGDGYLALVEAASDSQDPESDGDIYEGVILPGAELLPDTLGHALAIAPVKPGEPMVYYAGSGWSQGGIKDMDAWETIVKQESAALAEPLQVFVRK